MKKLQILSLVVLFAQVAFGQYFDKKAVEAELKNYTKNPVMYYNMKTEQTTKISSLEEQNLMLSQQNMKLKQELASIEEKLTALANAPKPQIAPTPNENSPYRVQLALSNNGNIMPEFKNSKVQVGTENGKAVYYISGFDNAEEAFNFSQSLRKMNLKGAFVTKYDNGSRDYGYNYLGTAGATAPARKVSGGKSRSNMQVEASTTPVTTTTKGGYTGVKRLKDNEYDALQDKLYGKGSSANSGNSYETQKTYPTNNGGGNIQVVDPASNNTGSSAPRKSALVIED